MSLEHRNLIKAGNGAQATHLGGLFFLMKPVYWALLDTQEGRLLHYAVFFHFSILPSVYYKEST